MVEWPQERDLRVQTPVGVGRHLADAPSSFIREIEGTKAFSGVVQSIMDAFKERADPKATLARLGTSIAQPDAFGDYDETGRQIVLALAGIAALRRTPAREMWEHLWSLAWHSAPLANYLPEAVVAAATEPRFREQFLEVARSVTKEAARDPGRREGRRDRGVRASLRARWHERPELSILWRGRFEPTSHPASGDDDNILAIVLDIDLAEFIRMLDLYDYPDPVAHALLWSGGTRRFERWRALASAAPTAFGEHSKWNGSLILPLLLTIARNQFQLGLRRELGPHEVSQATDEIKNIAAETAKVIASRDDAVGCMTRWGNWLVRTGIQAASANPVPLPSDAASQGFIESALLNALITETGVDRWDLDPAPDAETWEPWCQLAAGALVALAGKASMPYATDFLEQWCITPEEWSGRRGQRLRLHAIPFVGAGTRADGYGARLVALPLVEKDRADTRWIGFWNTTATLREIVEFGDADEADGGWQGRSDAARLLMFQFSIGLMMMDHVIWPQRPLGYDRCSALEGLLPLLDEAAREMAAIDQLNGKFWSEAVRHLAIRRVKWLSNSDTLACGTLGQEAAPTLVDFIRTLAGDTENLLAFAYVAQQNGVDRGVLATAFRAAEVDVNAELAIAENLLAISPRAIGLSEAQLNAARWLLNDISLGNPSATSR